MFNRLFSSNILHSKDKCDSYLSNVSYIDDEGDYNDIVDNVGANTVTVRAIPHQFEAAPIDGLQDILTANTLRLKRSPSSNYSLCSEASDVSAASFGSFSSISHRSTSSPHSLHIKDLQLQQQEPQKASYNINADTVSNLIVFDWDNTLFPTMIIREMSASSKIKRRKRNRKHSNLVSIARFHKTVQNSAEYESLSSLSDLIYEVLSTYIQRYGANNIRIVTASEKGWIQSSLFMVANIGSFKRIFNLIFIENEIAIIHPQSSELPFESERRHLEYKYRVFCELLKDPEHSYGHTIHSLVSIGDGIAEFEASKLAAATLNDANLFVDRIKLIQDPSIKDMKDEMNLLLTFCGVFEYTSHVDKKNISIDYEKEKKQRKQRLDINAHASKY